MRETKHRVMLRVKAGPTWKSGPPEDQPDWHAHADFVDALIAEGKFVMGGPFSDFSGTLVLFEGVTADEVRTIMEDDPFVKNGVFLVDDVRDWTVYIDELTASPTA
jgi:uncharacterized protein YciI